MKRQFLGNIYRDQSSVLAFVNIFPNTLYPVTSQWAWGALGSFIARLAFGFSWTLWPFDPWSLSTPMSLELRWSPEALGFLVSLCHLCLHVVLWILANRESPQCLLAPRVQGLPAYLEFLARKSRRHNHKAHMLETAESPTCAEKTTLLFYPDDWYVNLNDSSTVVIERFNSSNIPLCPLSYFQFVRGTRPRV